MKRKNLLVVFSAAFFIALLAVAAAPTNASPTNNWGVDEGTTLTYKVEATTGDHSTVYEYEITVVTIDDFYPSIPPDGLDDLSYSEKLKVEGSEYSVKYSELFGDELYSYGDILTPVSDPDPSSSFDPSTFYLYPILPIDDDGPVPGAQGLDWTAAKTTIEGLAPGIYDSAVVTESGVMFKVELEYSGSAWFWGDYELTRTVKWDKSTGTLESYSYERVNTDAGITAKVVVTKDGISEGFLDENVNVIAAAALGLAFLAFLMVLVKK